MNFPRCGKRLSKARKYSSQWTVVKPVAPSYSAPQNDNTMCQTSCHLNTKIKLPVQETICPVNKTPLFTLSLSGYNNSHPMQGNKHSFFPPFTSDIQPPAFTHTHSVKIECPAADAALQQQRECRRALTPCLSVCLPLCSV